MDSGKVTVFRIEIFTIKDGFRKVGVLRIGLFTIIDGFQKGRRAQDRKIQHHRWNPEGKEYAETYYSLS